MASLPCHHRTCAECGEPFATSQPTATFCSRACKTSSANTEAARGKMLYRLAYGWRKGSGASFSDLSWLVDQFIREDREKGRPAPPPYKGPCGSISQRLYAGQDLKKARARKLAAADS